MDFTNALNFIFAKEGGFSNDPTDRGGETNFGISQKANPDVDVKNLTKDQAAALYKARYWDAVGADSLPDNMKLIALDTAVQHGAGTARKMIESSGGDVNKILDQRVALYDNLIKNDPSQAKFANGWNNRLQSLAGTVSTPTNPSEGAQDPVKVNLQNSVAQMTQQKLGDNFILSKLADAGHGDEIEFAKKQGYTPAEIVRTFGGAPTQAVLDARSKVDAQGFLTNVAKGAGSAVDDLKTGAKQIGATLSGNEARLADLNAAEKARQSSPEYQAQQDTVGSKLGSGGVKALPYLAAAAVPEVSAPLAIALQGAAGVASGALTPTTGDGQRGSNMLVEGGLGALGGAAGRVVGGGAKAASNAVSGDAEAAARIAAAQQAGLPFNAATISKPNGFWRTIAENAPDSGPVAAFQAKADQAVASKVGEGLGLKNFTGAIDSDMLKAAEPGIKQGLDIVKGVDVTVSKQLASDVTNLVTGSANPLTEGIATNNTVRQAAANILKASNSGKAIPGEYLQQLNSELKTLVSSQGVSSAEKQIAGKMIGKLQDTLTDAMSPTEKAAYLLANKQYGNLKAVEKMVTASNDTGAVLPRQMLQAVKTGRFKNQFLDGQAPFQELASTASDLYGPAGGKGLASVLAKSLGGHDSAFEAASILHPTVGLPAYAAKKAGSALLARLASSENPAVVRLLTGAGKPLDPAVQKYITQALTGAGGASAS